MSEKLLPCPFCGPGNSCVDLWHDDVAKRWRVGCGACGCSTGTSPRDKTKAPAIAAWNRRTPAPEGEGKRLMLVDLDGAPFGSEFLDNLNGYATGGSGRCLDILTMWGATLYASPVVPVGVSEVLDAAAAYLKDTYGASYGLDHPVDRARILAALRPTDTGRE